MKTLPVILALILALSVAGCKTRYVPVESVRTEYIAADTAQILSHLSKVLEEKFRKENSRDSLFDQQREVIVLTASGDTARHDRERVVYRSSLRESELIHTIAEKDSAINSLRERLASIKVDTIREPVMVERELTRWEKAKMDFGGMAMGGSAIAVCFLIGWLVKRFKRM